MPTESRSQVTDFPEPLVFQVREGVMLVLVPLDGFSWVAVGQPVAEPGTFEARLTMIVHTDDQVCGVAAQAREWWLPRT